MQVFASWTGKMLPHLATKHVSSGVLPGSSVSESGYGVTWTRYIDPVQL
jgi:hypothetical protein